MYALLNGRDRRHGEAREEFARLLDAERLMTHNYVLVETVALVQRRLGMAAVGDLRDALLPVLALDWVDRELHERAAAAYVAAGRRDLSFVDHVSFELMRATAIPAAFAFDADFARVGFELLPAR